MEANIAAKVQSSTPGQRVELFDLDFTPIDPATTIVRWTPMSREGTSTGELRWQGNTYLPLPIEIEGVDVSGRGTLPRPILRISNVFGAANALIASLGTIGGAILTRWVTFADYLDTGATPNAAAHFPTDVFVLDRVAKRDFQMMEVECRSFIDFDRLKLPSRQMFNNFCSHTYRVWTGAAFDYTQATCPYVGASNFDENGTGTNAAGDKCGKRLSDCRLRFGTDPLPTRAFPGVGRIR